MKTQILVNDPIESPARLFALTGLSPTELFEVGDSMRDAKASVTENDAKIARGILAYLAGTRRLRDVAQTHGYERLSDQNLEFAYHPERKIRIMVSSTQEGTGDEKGLPEHKYKKGPMINEVVAQNAAVQMIFSSLLAETDRANNIAPIPAHLMECWFLCVYATATEVRMELSRPANFMDGRIDEWAERIIIYRDDDTVRRKPDPIDHADFEIHITRKTG